MNKYKWLLFDADNTFLDFTSASKKSLFLTSKDYGIPCDASRYKTYKKENAKVWESFENKEITAIELRSIRFAKYFEAVGFNDIDPLAFNTQYLTNLVEISEAYDGVSELFDSLLEQNYLLSVITNGLREVQKPRISKLGLDQYFHSIIVSDEIGVAKPDIGFFEHSYQSIPNPPSKSEMLVIGDNLKSDILGGINFGVDTCWIHHDRKNDTSIKPTYSIRGILDLPSII